MGSPRWARIVLIAGASAFAAWHYRAGLKEGTRKNAPAVPVTNPFSLTAAIEFGLLFAAMLLIVKLTEQYGPSGGVYLVAALSGTVDVDAITVSLARGGDAGSDAAIAIVSNTIVKSESGRERRQIQLCHALDDLISDVAR